MSLLITGFLPFQKQLVNPSQLLAEKLAKDLTCQCEILPVSFARASEQLTEVWRGLRTKNLVMLGQAGGRAQISFERVALNWAETSSPDEDNFLPQVGPFDSGPKALFNPAVETSWVPQLQKIAPCEISLSAGAFVCNALYYQALKQLSCKMIFIHLPYLPEQAPAGIASIALEKQYEFLSQFLKLFTNAAN